MLRPINIRNNTQHQEGNAGSLFNLRRGSGTMIFKDQYENFTTSPLHNWVFFVLFFLKNYYILYKDLHISFTYHASAMCDMQ